jgi:hypothetical protein
MNIKNLFMTTILTLMIGATPSQIEAGKLILSNTLGSQADIEHSQVGLDGTFFGGTFVPGRVAGTTAYHSTGGTQYITFPKEVIPFPRGKIEFWGKIQTNSDSLPWDGYGGGYWLEINDGITGYRLGFTGNNGNTGGGLCGDVPCGTTGTGLFGSWTYTRALRGGNVQEWHRYELVWNKDGIPGVSGGTHKVAVFIDGKLNTGYWEDESSGLPLTGGTISIPGYPSYLFAGRSLTMQDLKVYDDSAPPNLYATAVSSNAIRLSWDDNSSGATVFRIQSKEGLCNSANSWITRADVSANKATFLDGQLAAATPYSYQLSMYYGAGNFSAYSECVSESTGAAGTPHIPINLKAFSKSDSRVDLVWDDSSEDETAFKIYRKVSSSDWALLETVAEGTQSYSDATATGNDATTSYHYYVRACNAEGCSRPGTPPVVPFKPAGLTATVATTVKLSWKDKSSNESGFEIWRKNGDCESESPWVIVDTVAADVKVYKDASAVQGTVYSYKVRAYYTAGGMPEAFGYSRFTGCVSATAP